MLSDSLTGPAGEHARDISERELARAAELQGDARRYARRQRPTFLYALPDGAVWPVTPPPLSSAQPEASESSTKPTLSKVPVLLVFVTRTVCCQTPVASYLDLGLFAEAQRQLERSMELRRRALGDRAVETLQCGNLPASVYLAKESRRKRKRWESASWLTAVRHSEMSTR